MRPERQWQSLIHGIISKVQFKKKKMECLPPAERKSYSGTLKAGSEPRPISEITAAMTALSITIEVVFVSDEDTFVWDGHKTDSTAKKQPATAALKPDKKYTKQIT